nr:reverse transcriptase domain-containing protein [Tanacetum cinerariifolium]
MPASDILVPVYSLEESVGSSISLVILSDTETVMTVAPADIPAVILEVSQEAEAAIFASPTGVLYMAIHSNTESDPFEDSPSSDHELEDAPELYKATISRERAAVMAHSSSSDPPSSFQLEIPFGRPYRTYPNGVRKLLTARKRVYPYPARILANHRKSCYVSSSSPRKRRRVSPSSSSSSSSSEGLSCKRGRSPTTSFLPPRKRLRGSSFAVHQKTKIEDSTERCYEASIEGSNEIGHEIDIKADIEACTEVGIEASVGAAVENTVDVEIETKTEVETKMELETEMEEETKIGMGKQLASPFRKLKRKIKKMTKSEKTPNVPLEIESPEPHDKQLFIEEVFAVKSKIKILMEKFKIPPDSPPIIVIDPDDQSMWSNTRTVAPTPSSAIIQLLISNNFHIKGTHMQIIWDNQFDGRHVIDFLEISNLFQYGENQEEVVILRTFPFSLSREAKIWLNELNRGTITSWNELRKYFISRYFSPAKFKRLLNEIHNFHQLFHETLVEAWLRMKEMLCTCYGHDDVLPNHAGDGGLKSFDGVGTERMTKDCRRNPTKDGRSMRK